MKTILHRGDHDPDSRPISWRDEDVARFRRVLGANRVYVDERDSQCLVIEARRLYGPAIIERIISPEEMLRICLRTSFGFSWELKKKGKR